MSALAAQNLIHSEAQDIDDCWNRIGIYGDKSCPLLEQHIHCRNCAVYSSAATRLLDRYSFEQEHQELNAPQAHEEKVATCSLVIFRLGDEWLGLDPSVPGATSLRIMPRMLIVAAHGGAVVLPVDEVDGIHNIAEHEIKAASSSGEHASAKYTQGVLQWKTRSLRLLDEEQLLSAITRSLT